MSSKDSNDGNESSRGDKRYFHSVYFHGVDGKRRVQIPAKWRPADPEVELTLMIWHPPEQAEACLSVLPPEIWETLVQKVQEMKFSDPKAEALRRWLGKNSDRVGLDKSGRICLPDAMARAAGIEKEAVLVGLMDRFQIWSPERWEPRSQKDDELQAEAIRLI